MLLTFNSFLKDWNKQVPSVYHRKSICLFSIDIILKMLFFYFLHLFKNNEYFNYDYNFNYYIGIQSVYFFY